MADETITVTQTTPVVTVSSDTPSVSVSVTTEGLSAVRLLINERLPLAGGAMTGAITTSSTFDGRDVAVDGSKVDTIESGADVTDSTNVTAAGALMDSECSGLAHVKALNQSVVSGATPTFTTTNFTDASNKRLLTDAQETLLDSVEASADVTDATNVTAAGALMRSGGTMTGDLNTQDISLKDSDVAHGVTNVADTDAYGSLSTIHGTQGGLYINGISDQESASARSLALRGICNDTHTDAIPTVEIIGAKRSGTSVQALAAAETVLTVANHTTEVLTVLGNGNVTVDGTVDGRDVATDGTKLDGIEASADVTDTTNVTAAGALMDSECAGLAAVKATTGTFLSADESKLDGIEASADVTDATNVSAAGALMKSGGTMTGAVSGLQLGNAGDANYNKIENLDNGSSAQDAVAYGQISGIETTANAALPKAGGAMTGAITTNSTFDGVDIATRDAILTSTTTTAGAALPKAGGTMAGAIAMGSSKVTGLAEGTANGDALRFEQLRTIKNDQTGTTYTLVVGDATKTVRCNNASTVTVTVPKSIFIAGDVVTLFRKGAGGVTIAPVDGDVTINSVGGKLKLAYQYSAATLICVTGGATPEFDLIGDLTT